jgi:hypothetical protein
MVAYSVWELRKRMESGIAKAVIPPQYRIGYDRPGMEAASRLEAGRRTSADDPRCMNVARTAGAIVSARLDPDRVDLPLAPSRKPIVATVYPPSAGRQGHTYSSDR